MVCAARREALTCARRHPCSRAARQGRQCYPRNPRRAPPPPTSLTGPPPTPEEARAFLADPAPDANGRLIDRLLTSPRYGERWGRYWLDLAGYAESEGKRSADPVRPDAWRYRDYVIRSFNAHKPY